MKLSFKDFFRAIPVPFFALIMHADREPRIQDIAVWFLLFLALELTSLVMDWVGWHAATWQRFADVALFACLICRLYYLETEVGKLKLTVAKSN